MASLGEYARPRFPGRARKKGGQEVKAKHKTVRYGANLPVRPTPVARKALGSRRQGRAVVLRETRPARCCRENLVSSGDSRRRAAWERPSVSHRPLRFAGDKRNLGRVMRIPIDSGSACENGTGVAVPYAVP